MKRAFFLLPMALFIAFTAFAQKTGKARFHVARGNGYYERGDFAGAIASYTRAIALEPGYAGSYLSRGAAHYETGDLDAAVTDYTRAITIDPGYAGSYFNRGVAHYDAGDLDAAVTDYTRAIALEPGYAASHNNRGLAYKARGDLDAAVADFTRAITLDPADPYPYNNRGTAYEARGDLDAAIADYTRAIALDPGYTGPYNNRGIAYYERGDLDAAAADYTRAIALDPGHPYPYHNRGLAYSGRGDLEAAVADYTRAVTLDPAYARAYYSRGLAHYKGGDLEAAGADWESLLRVLGEKEFNEVFAQSWFAAADFYRDFPYPGAVGEDPAVEKRAGMVRRCLALGISRAEDVRAGLGARGAAAMTQVLYLYYAGLDLEALWGRPDTAFAYSEALRNRGFLDQLGTEAALGLLPEGAEKDRVRELTGRIGNLRTILEGYAHRNPEGEDNQNYARAIGELEAAEGELEALEGAITERVPRYGEFRNPRPAGLEEARAYCGEDTAVLEYALWEGSDYIPVRMNNVESFIGRPPAINSYCLVLTKEGVTAVKLDGTFDYLRAVNGLRNKITGTVNDPSLPLYQFEEERNSLYNALVKPALPHIPAGVRNIVIVPDGILAHLPFDLLRENRNSPDFGETWRLSLSPSVSVSVFASRGGALAGGVLTDGALTDGAGEASAEPREPLLAFGGAWYDKNKTAEDRASRNALSFDREAEPVPGRGGAAALRAEDAGTYYRERNFTWADLGGTEIEVTELRGLGFSQKPRIFLGREVSEERVKELSGTGELRTYPIVHFACHGYFNEPVPALSSIVFSEVSGLLGEGGEDGYLTVPEIAALDLDARMVMLSACETGLAQVRRGDGMVGLARSFLAAGAEKVGVSLWPISDEATVEFMTRLYRKVVEGGMGFREAYYAVKGEFRDHLRWDHPYYWAAFTMYE